MKKTLFITTDFPPMIGGVASYYGALAESLSSDELTLLAPDIKGADQFDAKQKYPVLREPFYYRLFWPRWYRLLRLVKKLQRANKYDMIVAGQLLPVGTVAMFLKLYFKVPYLVVIHGMDLLIPLKSRRKKKLALKILNNAETLVAANGFIKDKLFELGITAEKITIIHPGVNRTFPADPVEAALIEEQHQLQGKKVLLSVGRLVARKGFDTVIRSLPYVWKTQPDVVYVIVGVGVDLERLKSLVPPHANGRVIFVGEATAERLAAWYRRSFALIMLSRVVDNTDIEGFGMVYLEANTYAKPVIAADTGGVKDAVINGLNGIITDPVDPERVAGAIVRLVEDVKYAEALGIKGRERALTDFSWSGQAEKFQRLLS